MFTNTLVAYFSIFLLRYEQKQALVGLCLMVVLGWDHHCLASVSVAFVHYSRFLLLSVVLEFYHVQYE